jgi:hypothetical protein
MRVSRTSAQCFCSSLRAQAKQSGFFRSQNHVKARAKTNWIASSQALLAMTRQQSPGLLQALATPEKMIVQRKLVYNNASSLPRGFLRRSSSVQAESARCVSEGKVRALLDSSGASSESGSPAKFSTIGESDGLQV